MSFSLFHSAKWHPAHFHSDKCHSAQCHSNAILMKGIQQFVILLYSILGNVISFCCHLTKCHSVDVILLFEILPIAIMLFVFLPRHGAKLILMSVILLNIIHLNVIRHNINLESVNLLIIIWLDVILLSYYEM
jgi:hypothetical protein